MAMAIDDDDDDDDDDGDHEARFGADMNAHLLIRSKSYKDSKDLHHGRRRERRRLGIDSGIAQPGHSAGYYPSRA
jgi:hypothetical protein